jgi:hypothetical protein
MTKVINDSFWTNRRERAPLVWKIEKIDLKPPGEVRQIIVGAQKQEAEKSEPVSALSMVA